MSNSTETNFPQVTAKQLGDFLEKRREYHIPDVVAFKDLYLLENFVEQKTSSDSIVLSTACVKMLEAANSSLLSLTPLLGEIVQLRYFDERSLSSRDMYQQLQLTEASYYRRLDQAKATLADLINKQEKHERLSRQAHMAYVANSGESVQFIGASKSLARYIEILTQPVNRPITILTGIGGIGKTTIAEKGLQHALPSLEVDTLFRIDVPSGSLGRRKLFERLFLQFNSHLPDAMNQNEVERIVIERLQQKKSLIFIDGIEYDLASILSDLIKLSSPSTRIIITSREEPAILGLAVTHIKVGELAQSETNDLILSETSNLTIQYDVQGFLPNEIAEIYQAIGGHPLALKLVVGLLLEMPKTEILANLKQLQHPDTEEMYGRVYKKVWQALDSASQSLLISLAPLEDTQLSSPNLKWISSSLGFKLSELDVNLAINELRIRSLLEIKVRIEDSKKTYSLHNLTRTFIQQKIYEKL